jgi:hypothetical protein
MKCDMAATTNILGSIVTPQHTIIRARIGVTANGSRVSDGSFHRSILQRLERDLLLNRIVCISHTSGNPHLSDSLPRSNGSVQFCMCTDCIRIDNYGLAARSSRFSFSHNPHPSCVISFVSFISQLNAQDSSATIEL